MATLITEDSDNALWVSISEKWSADGKMPGHVAIGGNLYKLVEMADRSMAFILIEAFDYLDSRSLKPGKKATYSKLEDI